MLLIQSDFAGAWVKLSIAKILEISVSDIGIGIGIIGYRNFLKYRISVSDQKCDIGPSLQGTISKPDMLDQYKNTAKWFQQKRIVN